MNGAEQPAGKHQCQRPLRACARSNQPRAIVVGQRRLELANQTPGPPVIARQHQASRRHTRAIDGSLPHLRGIAEPHTLRQARRHAGPLAPLPPRGMRFVKQQHDLCQPPAPPTPAPGADGRPGSNFPQDQIRFQATTPGPNGCPSRMDAQVEWTAQSNSSSAAHECVELAIRNPMSGWRSRNAGCRGNSHHDANDGSVLMRYGTVRASRGCSVAAAMQSNASDSSRR